MELFFARYKAAVEATGFELIVIAIVLSSLMYVYSEQRPCRPANLNKGVGTLVYRENIGLIADSLELGSLERFPNG